MFATRFISARQERMLGGLNLAGRDSRRACRRCLSLDNALGQQQEERRRPRGGVGHEYTEASELPGSGAPARFYET
jgi:hypothetical protein